MLLVLLQDFQMCVSACRCAACQPGLRDYVTGRTLLMGLLYRLGGLLYCLYSTADAGYLCAASPVGNSSTGQQPMPLAKMLPTTG
jgi:hypothetical protein